MYLCMNIKALQKFYKRKMKEKEVMDGNTQKDRIGEPNRE